jgi:hypothetical protein
MNPEKQIRTGLTFEGIWQSVQHTFIGRQVINYLFLSSVMPAVLVGDIDQIGSIECPDAPLLLMACPYKLQTNVKGNVIVNNEFWRWMDRLYLTIPFHFLGSAALKNCENRDRYWRSNGWTR